jgi:DNA-binding NtrC family response regulator
MKHILVVDDEVGARESLKAIFTGPYRVTAVSSAREARKTLADKPVDLMLLDVVMPHENGVEFLKEAQTANPNLPVIMVSASTAVRPVVEAIQAGALDFVAKPYDVREIRMVVERTLERSTMRRQVEVLRSEVSREFPVDAIIGQSPAFRAVLDSVRKAADTDATVLVQGESGTGKELIARLLHSASPRREEPFVAVHCGALPESLMESELFGHEKGAFTNADRRKPGRFELAGNGTLFFDEVSEMSMATQTKLLRVLQEREYMRVGGTQIVRTNARIVTASNRDLRAEVAAKRFREDLFYRINVVPVRVPPLRERPEDVPLLARHFLGFFRQTMNVATTDFAAATLETMTRYAWPGNVRELRNIVERLLVLNGTRKSLPPECLPEEFQACRPPVAAAPANPAPGPAAPPPEAPALPAGGSLEEAVNAYERALVLDALKQARGVQTRAAEILGTTRRILKYRMDKLSIAEE